jgi:hypothetical protein
MLERKRVLKIREQIRQEGRRIFVYELPRSGEIFTIRDPDLKLDQLEQVQRDVARLLEVGLPVEASPTEEPFVPEVAPSLEAAESVEQADETGMEAAGEVEVVAGEPVEAAGADVSALPKADSEGDPSTSASSTPTS